MRDAVVIVLRDPDDRILVIRRGPAAPRAGYWMPPSGRVESGETQSDAVIREAREELGLAVEPIAKAWECVTDDGAFALHWWEARVVGGVLAPDPGEVAEWRFVDRAGFDALAPVFAEHRTFFAAG